MLDPEYSTRRCTEIVRAAMAERANELRRYRERLETAPAEASQRSGPRVRRACTVARTPCLPVSSARTIGWLSAAPQGKADHEVVQVPVVELARQQLAARRRS